MSCRRLSVIRSAAPGNDPPTLVVTARGIAAPPTDNKPATQYSGRGAHSKYAELHSLHEQLRAAKPYKTEPVLDDKKSLPYASGKKSAAQSVKDQSVRHDSFISGSGRNFPKSSAQVETLVLPPAVSPKSCELKLKGITGRRPSPFSIRVSETQKEIIRRKAQAAGISVGRYILATALGPDYKPPADPELVRALLALNRELTAQGNNLNQIAKHLNGGTASPTEGECMVGMVGRSILRTLKAVRLALTHGAPAP
jgi:hypothetical protein